VPLAVLPNPLLVIREAMLAQTAITSSPVQTRIHWGIPPNPSYPLWALSLVDDIELRPETLAVRVQVNVWGDGPTAADLDAAKASASLLRAVARDLNGDWSTGKVRNCVAPTTVPAPDPTSARVRLIVDLTFELNPSEGA
jgi:hypothetical protein